MNCPWCGHPVALHIDYYDGWCSADVLVKADEIEAPYNIACWCGGTEETRGPREVIGDRSIPREQFIP